MEQGYEDLFHEVLELKSKLSEVHNDLRRFAEHSNRQHVEAILSDVHKDFSEVVVTHLLQETEQGLESRMVKGCQMRETCKSLFAELLNGTAALCRETVFPDDAVQESVASLNEMRDKAPHQRCKRCFSEVERLFDSQIAIMQSMQIYEVDQPERDTIMSLPEESTVTQILEPMANRQRLQIMKALAGATNTFSGLSQLTGLRGGNLLFHLSKLLERGMILQRSERGDYMITEKGYKAIKGVAELNSLLKTTPSHALAERISNQSP
jgi:DNA-binding transcriptional ArsR family regulator